MRDDRTLAWRKSTYTNTEGACVEVTACTGDELIRDSKDPHGPRLRLPGANWLIFTAAVHAGQFD